MTDNPNDDETADTSTDGSMDVQTAAVNSNFKVLGQFTESTGVGVLGQNDANSGTPIGVQGAVPNNPSGGYGLQTPHNARIGQTAEIGAIGGGVAQGSIIDNLLGAGLGVSSNSLRIGSGGISTGMLGQNGASDGQTFVWDDATGSWTTAPVGSSKWADSDGNSLLEPSGSATGIDVTNVRTDTLADDGSGAVTADARVDLNGNDVTNIGTATASTVNADTIGPDGSTSILFSSGFRVEYGGSMRFSVSDTRVSVGTGTLTNPTGSLTVTHSDGPGDTLTLDAGTNEQNLRLMNLPTGTGTSLELDSATNQVVRSTSSARYKTAIEPLETDGSVLDLEPRSFEYAGTDQRDVGLVAEEVAETLPAVVTEDEAGRPESVKYDRLGVYLIPEVDRNGRGVETNERRIDHLEAALERKTERIEDLEEDREALRRENEALRDRLATIEDHLDIDSTGDQALPADD